MRNRMPGIVSEITTQYVPNMVYVANSEADGTVTANFGKPVAASANAITNATDVSAAGSVRIDNSINTQSNALMGPFGRAVSVVLSGAGTGNVIVRGRDYLGQRMSETIALNGTTAVNGKKAFRFVDSVEWPLVGASTTMNVGLVNIFGLPYKSIATAATIETKDFERSANAGAIVVGGADTLTQTATTADPRGTYAPSTVLPNGSIEFEIRYHVSMVNAHGNRHFAA